MIVPMLLWRCVYRNTWRGEIKEVGSHWPYSCLPNPIKGRRSHDAALRATKPTQPTCRGSKYAWPCHPARATLGLCLPGGSKSIRNKPIRSSARSNGKTGGAVKWREAGSDSYATTAGGTKGGEANASKQFCVQSIWKTNPPMSLDVPQCPRMSRESLFRTWHICVEMRVRISECSRMFRSVPRRSKNGKYAERTQTGWWVTV